MKSPINYKGLLLSCRIKLNGVREGVKISNVTGICLVFYCLHRRQRGNLSNPTSLRYACATGSCRTALIKPNGVRMGVKISNVTGICLVFYCLRRRQRGNLSNPTSLCYACATGSCRTARIKLNGVREGLRLVLLEQVTGIEPARPAWEAGVLPLNYTCIFLFILP